MEMEMGTFIAVCLVLGVAVVLVYTKLRSTKKDKSK